MKKLFAVTMALFMVLSGTAILNFEYIESVEAEGFPDFSFISVSAGHTHSVGLMANGTVWVWGNNDKRQVGGQEYGNTVKEPVLLKYTDGDGGYVIFENITAVVAGQHHSLALRDDGQVWAWGASNYGQTGYGMYNNPFTAVKVKKAYSYGVSEDLTGVIDIAAGFGHSLALKGDGTVWSWGLNSYGQLGTGTIDSVGNEKLRAVQVVGPDGEDFLTGVERIYANYYSSYAIKDDGSLWSWGWNVYGQLGIGEDNSETIIC